MQNLELTVGRAGGSPLAEDYLAGAARARAFFEGWWGDPDSYRQKADEVSARFDRGARERAARALRSPAPGAAARLEAWIERGGFAVTTGQQPGLFTGPAFSVYKALSAARLAAELEALLEVPVIPIFWVASEDHDWEESCHTSLVGVSNELKRFDVPVPAGQEGRPIHRIRPVSGVDTALAAFLAELPGTEFSPTYRALLEEAYRPERTLSEAFGDAMAALLAPFGVYVTDAADPAVKEASRSLLERELASSEAHERLLVERASALSAAGYPPQVAVLPGGVNLFVEGPAGRERLYRRDGGFHLRHSGAQLSADEVRDRIGGDDPTVSPNVLLRPVVESAIFPTLSLVVGPGEVGYMAQLGPYFQALGIRPPVAFPRFGATVVEAKVRKVLDKFALEPGDLRRPFHEIAAELAREELPVEAREALERIRSALDEGSAALADATRDIHQTLVSSVQRARNVSADAWSDAEKKVLQALKRESEVRLGQLEKAQLHLFPNGKSQERVLNVFYYLFRYGGGFLDALWERFQVQIGVEAPRP